MEWTSIFKNTLFFLLRFLLVILLLAVAFAVGTMLGYSVLGDGADPMEVFNPDLWEHILNFVFN
jgi:hypothetical protein